MATADKKSKPTPVSPDFSISSTSYSQSSQPMSPGCTDLPENYIRGCQNYITKCYDICKDNSDKKTVTNLLKEKVLGIISKPSIEVTNWVDEPLPVLVELPINQQQNSPSSVYPIEQVDVEPLPHSLSPLKLNFQSGGQNDNNGKPPSSESYVEFEPSPKVSKAENKAKNKFTKLKGNSKKKNKKTSQEILEKFESTSGKVLLNSDLLEKRAARFVSSSKKTKNYDGTITESFVSEGLPIVGLCQDIEKPYLRLTAAPDVFEIRPRVVLQKSFIKVKELWIQKRDYLHTCKQLKSIRQDLSVQNIRDEFTVDVYELHARIALETEDREEFNLCLSQLKLLHNELSYGNKGEFTAYRILYSIYTGETLDLNSVMISLTENDKLDCVVQHALKVLSAWALNNYHRLFVLYRNAPLMSSFLMDWFVPKERKLAIKSVIIAYRKIVPISFISQELGFQSDSLCEKYLSQLGLVFAGDENTEVDCKASLRSIYLETGNQDRS